MTTEGAHRVRSAHIVAALSALLCGCYTYVPVGTSPHIGAQVGIEVNDEGRVALREQLGPGVVRLEGRVAAVEGDELVVDASRVTQIRGLPLPLDSMRLRLRSSFLGRVDERRLSRTRTWMTIGGATAVVAVFLATKGFSARGTPPEEPPGGPPVNNGLSPNRVFGVRVGLWGGR
jgi:hypothetical protein